MEVIYLMSIKEFVNICATNAILFFIIFIIFILIFIIFITKKVKALSRLFDNALTKTQGITRNYQYDLKEIHILQRNILKNMDVINAVVKKYKGEIIDTKIYNNISEEIEKNLKSKIESQNKNIDEINYDEKILDEIKLKHKIGKNTIINMDHEFVNNLLKYFRPVDNVDKNVDNLRVKKTEEIFDMDENFSLENLYDKKE
jgi:hypothetical protein